MKTVISLCDLTGNMVRPWVDAGYNAFLVDPQHPTQDGWEWIGRDQFINRFSGTIEDAMDQIGASAFGKPQHTFHPADYTAHEPEDNYTKRTCLWTGGGFIMPQPAKDPSLGAPDNRIHFASPGPERANFRSATPMGFARAVFAANHQPTLEAAA